MASCGKYRSYTIILKLEVVRYAFNHSNAEASRRYGVHRKLVQKWCHQESELLFTSSSRRHLPGGGLKPSMPTKTKNRIIDKVETGLVESI